MSRSRRLLTTALLVILTTVALWRCCLLQYNTSPDYRSSSSNSNSTTVVISPHFSSSGLLLDSLSLLRRTRDTQVVIKKKTEYDVVQQDLVESLQGYQEQKQDHNFIISTDDASAFVSNQQDSSSSHVPPPPPPSSISKPPSLFVIETRRRQLDGREEGDDREGDATHLEIDCNDTDFDYEGDQLEACKQQRATSSPTSAATEYVTLFPPLDGGYNDPPQDETMGATAGTWNPTQEGTNVDDDDPPLADDRQPPPPVDLANGIRAHMSMAIIHLEDLTHDNTDTIVTMCLRTMTKVLNRYSHVVYVRDYLGKPKSSNQYNDEEQDFSLYGDEEGRDDDGIVLDDDDYRRHLGTIERQLRRRIVSINQEQDVADAGKDNARHLGNHYDHNDQDNKLAKLLLNDVHIQESPYMDNWFVIYADYAAYWMDSGRPVLQSQALYEIGRGCHEVLDISMRRGDFWDILTDLRFGQDLVLRQPDPEWPYQTDEHGLADCQGLGEEYDLFPYLLPPEFPDATGLPGNGSGQVNATGGTFAEVIATTASEVVWRTREWLGLALFLFTGMSVVSLSLIAAALDDRRQKQQLWGVTMTESGVNQMLNVGWRYTQEDVIAAAAALEADTSGQPGRSGHGGAPAANTNGGETSQLYLQVYDKGRLGYNDENSMLQGGVERLNHFGGDVSLDPPNSSTAPTTETR
jgi:hypothetical protein